MKIVEARGSFREVGRQIGEATREEIAFIHEMTVPDLLEAFRQDELMMRRTSQRYFEMAREIFPEACAYLRGLAEGAGQALHDVLPVAFGEELDAEADRTRGRDKCSTLVTRMPEDGWLIGHNEDFWPEFCGKMPVYDLRFDGWPRIVCLNYPGTLPGLSGSLNEAGVAITNNALWPDAVPGGLPKQIMHFRAALSADALDALFWISRGPHILTDHFVVASGAEDVAVSAEMTSRRETLAHVGADDEDVSFITTKQIIAASPLEPGQVCAPFAHTNHVRWLEPWASGAEKDPAHEGSMTRYGKLVSVAEHHSLLSGGAMLRVLTEKDGILNRTEENDLTGQPRSVTLATVVIAPSRGEIAFVTYGDGNEEPKVFSL